MSLLWKIFIVNILVQHALVTSQTELLKQGLVLILFYSLGRCVSKTLEWFAEKGEDRRIRGSGAKYLTYSHDDSIRSN